MFEGKVISLAGNKLVMRNKEGTAYSHTLAKDAKLTWDGKACKAEDLKAGTDIRVTTKKDDRNVATASNVSTKNKEAANVLQLRTALNAASEGHVGTPADRGRSTRIWGSLNSKTLQAIEEACSENAGYWVRSSTRLAACYWWITVPTRGTPRNPADSLKQLGITGQKIYALHSNIFFEGEPKWSPFPPF